jgi:hypothetical protein
VSARLNFLFVTTDSQSRSGDVAFASRVADFRLQVGEWPLYKNTRNQKSIKAGHRVLIYLGGRSPTAGVVIASARVKEIRPIRSPREVRESAEFLTDFPSSLMKLEDVERLPARVELRKVVPRMDCCPKNMKKWGIILHGGVRQLSDRDFGLIVSEAKKLASRAMREEEGRPSSSGATAKSPASSG